MNIFEINKEIESLVDTETGEITDFEKLNELNIMIDEKIKNVAHFIINLDSECKAIKEQEDKLEQRRKSKENNIKRLKEYLTFATRGQKKEFDTCVISFRKSEKVVTGDEFIDWAVKNKKDDYLKVNPPEIDKKEIKKDLKAGEKIPFACLEENNNITVK